MHKETAKMGVDDLVALDRVFSGLPVDDKPELLSALAERAGRYVGVPADAIVEALRKRESFGSTGIGRGIAIPHTAVKGLRRSVGFLARLEHPIDFESVDNKPVDLVFLLLTPPTPESENIAALASISRRLRDASVLSALRSSKSAQEMYNRLVNS